MRTVSIREARNRLTELARRAEGGERITITRHGKPVAELVPPKAGKGGIDLEAGRAYLRSLNIEGPLFVVADDFDDPLPEDFLLQPLPEPGLRDIG